VKLNQNDEIIFPFLNNLQDMIVMNSIKDANTINLIYHFPPNPDIAWTHSTTLINTLLWHKG
jgi:hypothetical protein